jgi:hypothetical protein
MERILNNQMYKKTSLDERFELDQTIDEEVYSQSLAD